MTGYPDNWGETAIRVKDEAGWRCQHCDAPNDPSKGYMLTVHHRDGVPTNCNSDNLIALCQRCHLKSQSVLRRYGPRSRWAVLPGFTDPR